MNLNISLILCFIILVFSQKKNIPFHRYHWLLLTALACLKIFSADTLSSSAFATGHMICIFIFMYILHQRIVREADFHTSSALTLEKIQHSLNQSSLEIHERLLQLQKTEDQLESNQYLHKSLLKMSENLSIHDSIAHFSNFISSHELLKKYIFILLITPEESDLRSYTPISEGLPPVIPKSLYELHVYTYNPGKHQTEEVTVYGWNDDPYLDSTVLKNLSWLPALKHKVFAKEDTQIMNYLHYKGTQRGVLIYTPGNSFFPDQLDIIMQHFSLEFQKISMYKKIKKMAILDSLSGVYLKRAFMSLYEEEFHRHQLKNIPFSLLMIDLDDFKHINDTLGHLKGDEAISILGKTLKDSCRNGDLICRYGGDEFLVFLTNTSKPKAQEVKQRIEGAMATIILERNSEEAIRPSISVGVSNFPRDHHDPAMLIEIADKDLYSQKLHKKTAT